jgi:3-deoxy-D-manno-octulosonic-acid transferase
MILFLYNVLLLLALAVSCPWWLFRLATTEKYREGFWERLGRVRDGLGSLENDGRRVIWVHAVSLGEVLAVTRLVADLDRELAGYRVLVSTTTRTGQWAARARFGAERVFYCPLDLPWATLAYLEALEPAMLVLAETEFWPNLLSGCYRRGIPVVVANARISDRSWPRYWRLRGLWRPFLSQLTAVLAQSELDAERLSALGCERVTVAGNLKFDVRSGRDSEAVRLLEGSRSGLHMIVAGSTLEGEEAALLGAWPALLHAEPGLAMVMAPRHPERFKAVAELLDRSGFAWRRRTMWGKRPLAAGEIVLLDSLGELATVYSVGAVAFVGGSLVEAGGHNPLEPAQFGVPVLMGPHYANFRAIVERMRERDALRIVAREGLEAAIGSLLADPEGAAAMGARGLAVFAEQAGATGRTVRVVRRILEGAA